MQTPWAKFPSINSRSRFWSEEEGKSYLQEWREFLEKLSEEEQKTYKKQNPAPFYWFFAYWQVMDMWLFSYFILLLITSPLRFIHFKMKQK